MVNSGFPVFDHRSAVGTDPSAGTAAYTQGLVNAWFSITVLLHLTSSGAGAHADIFDGAAKSGHLVALKMGQGNQYVSIHNGMTDLRLFYVFAIQWD